MNETDETFIEIKLTNDKNLLYYNKSGVFKVGNGNFLNDKIVDDNTTLKTLTNIYDCLIYDCLLYIPTCATAKYEKTEIEVMFKFFELANKLIKNMYNSKKTDAETKKNIEKLKFIHRVGKNSYSFEYKDISGKDVDDIFMLEKNNCFYMYHKNTYPRWFSLCGGLNFDYDYYCADISSYVKRKTYYKINEETNTTTEVSTRDKNGWIVKDGWIDKVGNFCSENNLCCCFCDCYNR